MYKLIKNKQMETIMKNTKKLLTQALIIAATLTSAAPVKRKFEKLENKEIESKDQNKKKKLEPITKKTTIFSLLLQKKITKNSHKLKSFFINKYSYTNLKPTDRDENAIRCIFEGLMKACITETLINDAWLISQVNEIKNVYLRNLFFDELIKHLRTIITEDNAQTIQTLFLKLKDESSLKYAIRCVYYEKTQTLIDNQDIIQTVMDEIATIDDDGELTLNFCNVNSSQQLESFLMLGHELLQPLSSKIIKILTLYNNQITQVPNFNLPNLEYLSLEYNELTQVPNFNLPNLKHLSLEYNKLTQVPNFKLPNLEWLGLYNNELTQVPDFNLPNLEKLLLDHNQLTQVPDFKLPGLEMLNLNGNELTQVPNFKLSNLKFFWINSNKLIEVPNFKLPNLRELSLENNHLTQVPNFNLPNLEKLFLNDNNFPESPSFTKIPESCSVDISYSQYDKEKITSEFNKQLKLLPELLATQSSKEIKKSIPNKKEPKKTTNDNDIDDILNEFYDEDKKENTDQDTYLDEIDGDND